MYKQPFLFFSGFNPLMFKQVLPNVFAFVSGNDSCNCFLLKGAEKIALVDSGAKSNEGKLLSGLEGIGVKPEQVSMVLHSHGHADHLGCDGFFPNARVAMHGIDAKMVNEKNGEFACTSFFPGTALPKVSMMLKDKQKIGLGNLSLEVIHTPGHTAGSICFLLRKEMALFSGDTLFAEGFGRADLPSGNAQELVESLKRLQKLNFKALFPGHGPLVLGGEENSLLLGNTIRIASEMLP